MSKELPQFPKEVQEYFDHTLLCRPNEACVHMKASVSGVKPFIIKPKKPIKMP